MRINLFGGPGCGKSTTSARLFADLNQSFNIELVPEFIKKWAYLGLQPTCFQQVYVFGKQLYAEDHLLANGVNHIITDSPLMLQLVYAKKAGFPCLDELINITKSYEAKYPSINIFLDRTGLEYHELGRYQTYEQALQVDKDMIQFLNENNVNYKTFKTVDVNEIYEYLKGSL